MAPILLIIIFLNATGAPMQGYNPAQYEFNKISDCQAQVSNLNAMKNGTVSRVFAFCVDRTAH